MNSDPLLTVHEAAHLFRVSRRTAYRRIASGEWPAVRDGGRWLLRESWILAELQTRQVARVGDELAHDAEIRERVLSGRRATLNNWAHSGTDQKFTIPPTSFAGSSDDFRGAKRTGEERV